jgi:hypothetical protein
VAAVLLLYLFPPLTFLAGMFGLWRDSSHWRRYLPMCIYFLFIGAYSYEPDAFYNFDLIRYFPQIESYGSLSLGEALEYDVTSPAKSMLFWFFGSLQMKHMVPALTTATVYAVAGYITCDTAERYNGKQYIGWCFLIQLILLPYVSIINNIRNVFGLALVVLAVYLDIVKGKRNIFVYFCYLFGSLMHLSVVILVLFRLASFIGKNYFDLFMYGALFFAASVFKVYELRSLFAFGGSLGIAIQSIIIKLNAYLLDTTNSGAVKYLREGVFTSRTFIVVSVFLSLLVIRYAIRSKNRLFQDDKRLYAFAGMTALITITFHFFMLVPNYWRFAAALNVMVGIIYIPLLCGYKGLTVFPKLLFCASLAIVPIVLFFHAIAFLRSLYNSPTWPIDFLTTNYVTILFDLVQGIVNI